MVLFAFCTQNVLANPINAGGGGIGPQSNCTIQNTFPNNYVSGISHFGASRSGGARWHAGIDLFLPVGTAVTVPLGCNVKIYSDGTPIFKSDPTGYGNYMLLDCGTQGGDTITLRYAHIAGYDTNTGQIMQGRTGISTASIPDHYHYEVLIGNVVVDPECVLGLVKGAGPNSPLPGCQQCPPPTGNGPANLCDAATRTALLAHSRVCHHGATITKNIPGGSSVAPNRIPPSGVSGSPTVGTTGGGGAGGGGGHNYNDNITSADLYQGNINTLFPPLPPGYVPPPRPPGPNGTPGGPPSTPPVTAGGAGATDPNSGCAVDTWISMVNQAVLESRRENIFNQRLIAKADSVLTYSCFDSRVRDAGTAAGPIFSESNLWANRSVDISGQTVTINVNLGSSSLDGALTVAVDQMAATYLGSNFGHGLLGETATVAAPTAGGPCNVMNTVWNAAKCNNMGLTFMDFQALSSSDPRDLPASMRCGP